MKNIYISGIIAALILLTTGTFVYAHGSTQNTLATNNEFEDMDEMHEEMIQYIDDPELVNEMNEMHAACSQDYKDEKYNAVEGNMMASNNEMNNLGGMMNGIGNMMGRMMGMGMM